MIGRLDDLLQLGWGSVAAQVAVFARGGVARWWLSCSRGGSVAGVVKKGISGYLRSMVSSRA